MIDQRCKNLRPHLLQSAERISVFLTNGAHFHFYLLPASEDPQGWEIWTLFVTRAGRNWLWFFECSQPGTDFISELLSSQGVLEENKNMHIPDFFIFFHEHKGVTPLWFSRSLENRLISGKAWCVPYSAQNALKTLFLIGFHNI